MSIPGPETREWLFEGPNGPVVSHHTRRRGAMLSGLYDSRDMPGGIGFPSCNRELARLAPNDKDPHDYYAEIGVARDATSKEIRSAIRRLVRLYHPDTSDHPDSKKLTRLLNIGKVLLDPVARERYNRTPPGARLMDAVYAQELIDAGIVLNDDDFEIVMDPRPAYSQYRGRYDFFAIDHTGGDSMLANMWYHQLIAAARYCGYRQIIKVMLTDSIHPSWNEMASIIGIPRTWSPSYNLAIVLYHHAGFDTPEENRAVVGIEA